MSLIPAFTGSDVMIALQVSYSLQMKTTVVVVAPKPGAAEIDFFFFTSVELQCNSPCNSKACGC